MSRRRRGSNDPRALTRKQAAYDRGALRPGDASATQEHEAHKCDDPGGCKMDGFSCRVAAENRAWDDMWHAYTGQ